MRKAVFIMFVLIGSCAPNQKKFEKSKWNEYVDGIYTCREEMVTDLIQNHLTKGMKYEKVIELLGKPVNSHSVKPNEINYEIMVDYGKNIDPVEGEVLYLKFDKDSLLTNIELKYWAH